MSQVQSHVLSTLKLRSRSLQPEKHPSLSSDSSQPKARSLELAVASDKALLKCGYLGPGGSNMHLAYHGVMCEVLGCTQWVICTRLKLSLVQIARMMESRTIWYTSWEPTLTITDQRSSLIACQDPGCLTQCLCKAFAEQTEAP